MTKLISSFTRVLIPFTNLNNVTPEQLMTVSTKPTNDTENNPDSKDIVSNQGNKNDIMVWEEARIALGLQANHLFPNIVEKFTEGHRNQILHSYTLRHDARSCFGLPKRPKNDVLTLTDNNKTEMKPIDFLITNVQIHLFETGTGFLDFEIRGEFDSFEDRVTLNYDLVELYTGEKKNFDANITYSVKKNKDDVKTEVFNMEETVNNLLNASSIVTKETGNDHKHKKPLVYSFAALDTPPDLLDSVSEEENIIADIDQAKELKKWLFTGANTFNWNFTLNNTEPQVYTTFKNSYWAMSSHGAFNISWSKDENSFIHSDFKNRVCQHYFYLYLLAANQYLTLMNFIDKIDDIIVQVKPKDDSEIIQTQNRIENLSEQISMFKIRDTFLQVSYYDHINDVYERFRSSFALDRQLAELADKAKEMKNLYTLHADKIVMKYRYEKGDTNQSLCRLVMIIGGIALLDDSMSIISYFTSNICIIGAIAAFLLYVYINKALSGDKKIRIQRKNLYNLCGQTDDND